MCHSVGSRLVPKWVANMFVFAVKNPGAIKMLGNVFASCFAKLLEDFWRVLDGFLVWTSVVGPGACARLCFSRSTRVKLFLARRVEERLTKENMISR